MRWQENGEMWFQHGGDVTVIHLPEMGIKGNTHFPFSVLNNTQVADLVSQFIEQKIYNNSRLLWTVSIIYEFCS